MNSLGILYIISKVKYQIMVKNYMIELKKMIPKKNYSKQITMNSIFRVKNG